MEQPKIPIELTIEEYDFLQRLLSSVGEEDGDSWYEEATELSDKLGNAWSSEVQKLSGR